MGLAYLIAYFLGGFIMELPIVCIFYGITKIILIKIYGNDFRNVYLGLAITVLLYSITCFALNTAIVRFTWISVLILIYFVELFLNKRKNKKQLSYKE